MCLHTCTQVDIFHPPTLFCLHTVRTPAPSTLVLPLAVGLVGGVLTVCIITAVDIALVCIFKGQLHKIQSQHLMHTHRCTHTHTHTHLRPESLPLIRDSGVLWFPIDMMTVDSMWLETKVIVLHTCVLKVLPHGQGYAGKTLIAPSVCHQVAHDCNQLFPTATGLEASPRT